MLQHYLAKEMQVKKKSQHVDNTSDKTFPNFLFILRLAEKKMVYQY